MSDKPVLFADGILEASVNYGVTRITLAQTGSEGKPVPCGQLMIPVVQLPAFANSVVALLKQIDAKVKQAQQQPAAAEPAAEQPEPQAVPGSFRFSG
ncbi:hypothetical protein CR162_01820 [Pseudoroseomonas rhizosphaerae]|uniref:Uncharacterized protein n=1 Tax=Teichococcus rhizosphaerae TaxID=1335062 RepID=A0A2C7AIT5_9PROT|nr:hypothetical protein [Pseudoroseomonas rhizosphaerae]PHK96677.1 hypothetical protein CR162_01820 [Pseudoroseomonas rhizosphaerae]